MLILISQLELPLLWGKVSQMYAHTTSLQPPLNPLPQFYILLFFSVPTSLAAFTSNLFPKLLFYMFIWRPKIHIKLKQGVNIYLKIKYSRETAECTSNSTHLILTHSFTKMYLLNFLLILMIPHFILSS